MHLSTRVLVKNVLAGTEMLAMSGWPPMMRPSPARFLALPGGLLATYGEAGVPVAERRLPDAGASDADVARRPVLRDITVPQPPPLRGGVMTGPIDRKAGCSADQGRESRE